MNIRFPVLVMALFVLAACGTLGSAARAQSYPTKPITLVVPGAAGGASDSAARAIARQLSGPLGQQVIVDNKPGAGGDIGTSSIVRAEPDGYTLLVYHSAAVIHRPVCPCCLNSPSGDCCAGCGTGALAALTPVATLLAAPQVIVARSDLGIRTLPDLVSHAKSHPAKLTFASAGTATLPHLTGVLLEQSAGIKLQHVPYRGMAPALGDLLGGRVDLIFAPAPSVAEHIQAGRLVPLAVTGTSRLTSLREVPTVMEAGYPQLNVDTWCAIYAPSRTPAPVIEKLAAEINKAAQSDSFKRLAQEQGAEVTYTPPDQLGRLTRDQLARWDNLMKATGIRPE